MKLEATEVNGRLVWRSCRRFHFEKILGPVPRPARTLAFPEDQIGQPSICVLVLKIGDGILAEPRKISFLANFACPVILVELWGQ